MEDSILKFKVEINSTSFQQVKQQIADLKREVEGLAKALQGIKLPGGGGLLSGISTGGGVRGLPSSSGATTGVQSPGQAVGGILTQGLVADKNLFRTITEGSKEALRAMKDALKQSAQEQEQIIKRLKGEIDSLSKSYNNLSNTGGLGGGLQGNDLSAMLDKGRQLSDAQKNLAATQAASGGGGFLGMAGRALGGGGFAAFGTVGAAIGAGAYLYDKVANSYYDTRNANLQWGLDRYNAQQGAQGAIGQSLGGLGLGIRRGDVAGGRAFSEMMKARDVQNILSRSSVESANLINLANSNLDKKTIGGVLTKLGGAASADLVAAVRGGDVQSVQQILYEQAVLKAGPEAAQRVAQGVESAKNRDPFFTAVQNEFYSGRAQRNVSLSRSLGVSEVDRSGHWHDLTGQYDKVAARAGLELDEYARAVNEAGPRIGRGNRFKGASFLGKQFGGYENVYDVFNTGQQYGSGDALVRAIGGRGGAAGGKQGIDAKAAVLMGGLVTQQMQSSTIGMNGIDLAEGLGGVIGLAGNDIGGQLRLANQLKAGLSVHTAELAGQMDPLNAAINAYAGASAFKGDFYSMDVMTRMNAGDMISMLRSGKVSDRLSDMGVNIGQVREYAATQDKFALSRYMNTGRNTQLDQVVGQARQAGGPMAFLKNQLSGLHGKAYRTRALGLTRQLGEAEGLGLGVSGEDMISSLRAQLGVTAPEARGTGLGDPHSRKSVEQVRREAEATQREKEGKKLEENEPKLRKTIEGLGSLGEGIESLSKAMQTGGTFSLSIENVTTQMYALAGIVSKITGIPVSGAAKPTKVTPKGFNKSLSQPNAQKQLEDVIKAGPSNNRGMPPSP